MSRRRRRNAGAALVPTPLHLDNFNKPNNASSPGLASNGEPWEAYESTWGIISNLLYQSSQTGVDDPCLFVECFTANGHVQIDHVPWAATVHARVVGRVVDGQNHLRVVAYSAGTFLYKVVAGVTTFLKSDPTPFPAGGRLGLLMLEDQVAVTVNDAVMFWVTETAHQTATKHGVGINVSSLAVDTRYDNFGFIPMVLDTVAASVELTPAATSVVQGGQVQLVGRAYNSIGAQLTGKTITAVSADESLATVTPTNGASPQTFTVDGVLAGGPVNIVATADAAQDTTAITVNPPLVNFTDTFNRANSSTSAGTAPNGNPWVAEESVWGISSNQLYQVSQVGGALNEPVLLLETGRSNFYYKAQWTAGSQIRVVGRGIDKDNYWFVLGHAGGIVLYRVLAGAHTAMWNPGGQSLALNDYLGLRMDGDQITVVKNDVDLATITGTAHQTATKVGFSVNISAGATAYRYDNATFAELTAAPPTPTTVEIIGGDVTDFLVDEHVSRTAVVKDQYGDIMPDEVVVWSSEDELIFTVDPDLGVLTAVAAGGPVDLIASSGAATPGTVNVTVTARVATTITLDPPTTQLFPGDVQQLTWAVKDQHDVTIVGLTPTFASDDTDVAPVDAAGLITALEVGAAIITASSAPATPATMDVTVVPQFTLFEEADILMGGDGTGTKLVIGWAADGAIFDVNGVVTSLDTIIGPSNPMTIIGSPTIDEVNKMIVHNAANGDIIHSAVDALLNHHFGGTIIMIVAAFPSAGQTLTFGALTNASDTNPFRLIQDTTGVISATVAAPPNGSIAVATSVPLSGVKRFMAAKRPFNDFTPETYVYGVGSVTGSGTLTANPQNTNYKLTLGALHPTHPTKTSFGWSLFLYSPDVLTDTQLDALAEHFQLHYEFEAAVPPSSNVDSVTVTPEDLLITVGNQYQLVPTAWTSTPAPIPGEGFTYQTSNPAVATVSPTGLITAAGTGSCDITATSTSNPAKSAVCSTVVATAVATDIIISPKVTSVGEGATVQFSSTIIDQSEADDVSIGFPMAGARSYSSGTPAIATINSSTGVATGVDEGGPVVITVTAGALSDTASLTVVVPSVGLPNEPAGFILLNDRPFLTVHPPFGYGAHPQYPNPADLHYAEGWTSIEGRYVRVTSQVHGSAPQGDSRVGQQEYVALMRSGVAPGTGVYMAPLGVTEVYISFMLKLSNNWIANRSNTNKMMFLGLNGGNNQLILSAHGSWVKRITPRITFQGIQEIDFRDDFDPSFNFQNLEMKRGVWTQIEIRILMHSTPQSADGSVQASNDGEIDLWVDGQPQQTFRNMRLAQKAHPTRTPAFTQINWNPTFGGGGAGIPKNFVDANDANGVFTRCRQYIYDMSLLPLNQRPAGDEQLYGTPTAEFAIDPSDESQYLWLDRSYISHNG